MATTITDLVTVKVRATIKDTSNLHQIEVEEDRDRRHGDTRRRIRIRTTRLEDKDREDMAAVEEEAVQILGFKVAEVEEVQILMRKHHHEAIVEDMAAE
jgi:hypothetical protein